MLGLITILSCNNKVENVGTLSKANNEIKFKIKANIIPMGSAKLTELGTCGDLLNFTANNDAISSNGCPENTYLDYDAYRFEPVYNQDGTIAIGYNCTYENLYADLLILISVVVKIILVIVIAIMDFLC
ncbi:MAG: hypothetical protein U0457_19915 [Candidatus Sericytochromatia bacterium]